MTYVIVILATWRISSLFAREEGPFDIFEHIRSRLFSLANRYKGSFLGHITDTLSRGIICIWCNSIWFSFISSLVVSHSFTDWLLNSLFISSVVIVFDFLVSWIKRLSNG